MTPAPKSTTAARDTDVATRPSLFNGFGGTMLRGLMLGGLIGLLLGYGFGGFAGVFGLLLQVLLIGGALMLLMRLFQSAQSPQPAPAGPGGGFARRDLDDRATGTRGFSIPGIGSGSNSAASKPGSDETRLTQADLDTFQRRLTEVQEAFGREDHAALRRLATPEMVSFLSEELAENAQKGVRNDVSDVQLHQADIAESWREGDRDCATAALQYSSRDVTRDRTTGALVDGDDTEPTETTELWTFVRQNGGEWKLSAIQQA